jgi:hypothetical protein
METTSLVVFGVCLVVYLSLLPTLKRRNPWGDARSGLIRTAAEWDWGSNEPEAVKVLVRVIYAGIFMGLTWRVIGVRLLHVHAPVVYAVAFLCTAAATLLWPMCARLSNRLLYLGAFVYGENRYSLEAGPLLTVLVNTLVVALGQFWLRGPS